MFKLFILGLFMFQSLLGFSQSLGTVGNYPTNNGVIIEQRTVGGAEHILRRHEQEIHFSLFRAVVVVSEPFEGSHKVYELTPYPSSTFLALQILSKIYPNIRQNEVWVKIKNDKGNIGWVNITNQDYDNPAQSDPYWNNNGKISEIFRINNRTKTAITLSRSRGGYVFSTRLNVRDIPSPVGSNILFQLNQDSQVEYLAVTFEEETIDGIRDKWIKIRDDSGRTGWAFGGYIGREMFGLKYSTPDDILEYCFTEM